MRIIAGTHRGRTYLSPEGQNTRPITDRVKQALFDRLWAHGRLEEDSIVLDLFAGTGSMGLECLSRGVKKVTFVERDKSALKLLRTNIETLKEGSRSVTSASDALSAGMLHTLGAEPLTLVFVDPPYTMTEEEAEAAHVKKQIERLAAKCAPGAWLILRTETGVSLGEIMGWAPPVGWAYGSMTLHMYEKPNHS